MANEQNLRPIRDSEVARKLQERSVAKRKENAELKMILKDEILKRITSKDLDEIIEGVIKRAKKQDKSFEVFRDTIGQKPTDNIALNETKLPIFNIQVTDNKELEKEFDKYDE